MQDFNLTCTVDNENRVYCAEIAGELTPQDVFACYGVIVRRARRLQLERLLLDFSQAELDYNTADVINTSQQLINTLTGFRIARVIRAEDFRQDVIERIFADSSTPLRNFDDFPSALAWLTE